MPGVGEEPGGGGAGGGEGGVKQQPDVLQAARCKVGNRVADRTVSPW